MRKPPSGVCDLYRKIVSRIGRVYPPGEACAVARVLLEDGFGVTPADVLTGKVMDFPPHELERLDAMAGRLEKGEPVQYVTGCARFGSRTFEVRPGVFIPRPETLELAEWALRDLLARAAGECRPPRVLDIGTGSGCIAVTLAASVPGAAVSAVDISATAVETARRNAAANGADVEFAVCDILAPDVSINGDFDVIISNPPYVCASERAGMHRNVLRYEPPGAIFVDDARPLVFYEAIARFAAVRLVPDGAVYVEANGRFAEETAGTFRREGFAVVEVREDSYGIVRMIKAGKEKR